MGCCYTGTESLYYGNWNRQVIYQTKYAYLIDIGLSFWGWTYLFLLFPSKYTRTIAFCSLNPISSINRPGHFSLNHENQLSLLKLVRFRILWESVFYRGNVAHVEDERFLQLFFIINTFFYGQGVVTTRVIIRLNTGTLYNEWISILRSTW